LGLSQGIKIKDTDYINMKRKLILLFCLLFLLNILFVNPRIYSVQASGTTIYVDGRNFGDPSEDGSIQNPYNTIQEGVDGASSGDTVFIANWTYNEAITVNKTLTLLGEDSTKTIIDGGGSTNVVRITTDNVTIEGLTIQNGDRGILIDYSDNCTIIGNTIIDQDDHGIYVWHSNNNTIAGNVLAFNSWTGIFISSSHNNTIISNTIGNNNDGFGYYESDRTRVYLNNIMDNTRDQATLDGNSDNTIWEGNYWSNYNGSDTNGDGIGDTPHSIWVYGDQDSYPMMQPWPLFFAVIWDSTPYNVSVISNSTITAFGFNQPSKQIVYNVTRPTGKQGYCNITIPKTLLGGSYSVSVNGSAVSPTEVSNATHSSLYFTYNHSTVTVSIIGTTVIPEFTSPIILSLLIVTLITVAITKRKFFTEKSQ
jgi:parallel beta-helix repeat protein